MNNSPFNRRCWCVVYSVLVAFVSLAVGVTMILGLVPQATPYAVPIHEGDTVLVPIHPPSWWLTSLSVGTNGSCSGHLYKFPCDELTNARSYAANYSTFAPGVPSHFDFIFCLENSTFRFSVHPQYNGVMNKEVWLFDNYNDRTAAKNSNFSGLDCSNPPSYSRCTVLNNSNHPEIVTWVPGEEGSFYNLICRSRSGDSHPFGCVGVQFYISRYYYNTSAIPNRYYGKVGSTVKLVVRVSGSDVCLLLNTTARSCQAPYTDDYALIAPSRKQDFLLWPGLFIAVMVMVLLAVLLMHLGLYCRRQKRIPVSIEAETPHSQRGAMSYGALKNE